MNIIIHKDKVLVCNQSIIFSNEIFDFLKDKIVSNIKLDNFNLIEISLEIDCYQNFADSKWLTIREALKVLENTDFPLLIKSSFILKWDKNHKFCGRCANLTALTNHPYERYCDNCEASFYPRISPAIIVLIHRGEEILMARSPHHQQGVYALIAGFVEAGETLEQAVHREVFEEVGIKIKNLSYHGSQPWPFQESLMVGFIAEYESGEIVIDKNEIEAAGWYKYDNLPGLPAFSKSIAFDMINKFIALNMQKI